MTPAEEKFQSAFLDLVTEDEVSALTLVTGFFVGLTLEVVRREGHEPDGEVKIDGGAQRDITIHARKGTNDNP